MVLSGCIKSLDPVPGYKAGDRPVSPFRLTPAPLRSSHKAAAQSQTESVVRVVARCTEAGETRL
jgi:hypothetical protein